MYERRLKIFFGILVAVTLVLLLRAAHLQIINAQYYHEEAANRLQRSELLSTTRGDIVDCKGRVLATDAPCLVASVDYRAIIREPKWLETQALRRLGSEYRRADAQRKKQLLDQARQRVNADLDLMWQTLALVSGKSLDDIEHTKAAVCNWVDRRRRVIWYKRFSQAQSEHSKREPETWFKEWLLSGEGAPELDAFSIEVAEQFQPHVILDNISTEVYNRLNKQIEQFPGLVLNRSKHRLYSYAATACSHILGHLSSVNAEDLLRDPNTGNDLREYAPNDVIGRTGVEALCEQTLRGTRGLRVWNAADRELRSTVEPLPGKTVRLTIDADLQMQIEDAFRHVQWVKDGKVEEEHEMHGAAVVIDVPTGQVRAMVSYPNFDPNQYDQLFPILRDDRLNQPLLNRATMLAVEPGSTVKPIVGIGAITQGLTHADHGIECTGYLIIDGRRYSDIGRCWTAKRYAARLGDAMVAHHKIGQEPHPTGFLTFADALQRSCNVYFETLGDRLRIQGLSHWFRQFGLGRKTGIGIPEDEGWVPDSMPIPPANWRSVQWFSAIGQAQVAATPLQMANVAATIARDGTWLRPTLLTDDSQRKPLPSSRPAETVPDRRDLDVSPRAIAAAKEGMIRVVNTRAGTGQTIHNDRVLIAGKTGTAQATPLRPVRLDADGKLLRDEKGRILRDEPRVSTRQNPNPDIPWYRSNSDDGKELSHAWFIGFAPARNPRIAFAVLLEYGGGGGTDGGIVAKAVLDACIEHGYLLPEER